jgi:hypothetical protein
LAKISRFGLHHTIWKLSHEGLLAFLRASRTEELICLNIYRSEKCFEQNLKRMMKDGFRAQYKFSANLMDIEIIYKMDFYAVSLLT